MPKKGDVHVVPKGEKWQVEVEGNDRAFSTHDTQAEAIPRGRQMAMRNESELLVHGKDGKIRERNTYGRDPKSSKG
jgi:Uncharacterized protein conserved in bacteria (DUF2188)